MRLERIPVFLGLGVLLLGEAGEASPGRSQAKTQDALGPALEEALAQPSRFDRLQRLTASLAGLDAENVDEAVAVFELEHWWLSDAEIDLFMEAWTRFDPASAVEYAARWPWRTQRPEALAAAVQAWALRDPEEAARKVEELAQTNPRIRGKLVDNLLTGWVQSGRPGALEYTAAAPSGTWPVSAMVIAAGQTRRLRVPAVLEWADGVVQGELPEDLRKNVFRRVTGMASRQDPEAVAAWVEKHAGRAYADQGTRILAERWVSMNPEAVLRWVSASIPADERTMLLRHAFSRWLIEDFSDAAAWVEAASADPRHDPAFAAYANVLAQRDPEAALPWAEKIQDEGLRLTSLERIAASWYRRDPVAAETWLESSALEEAARKRVRQAPDRRPARPLDRP